MRVHEGGGYDGLDGSVLRKGGGFGEVVLGIERGGGKRKF